MISDLMSPYLNPTTIHELSNIALSFSYCQRNTQAEISDQKFCIIRPSYTERSHDQISARLFPDFLVFMSRPSCVQNFLCSGFHAFNRVSRPCKLTARCPLPVNSICLGVQFFIWDVSLGSNFWL